MSVNKPWTLPVAIGVVWAMVTVLIIVALNMNQGHLIYPLDDAYIHMAMAKNFALHHVWGVTKYGFTSSTSSPLWTMLLAAAYFLFGVNEITPLLFNLLFGTLTVGITYYFLQKNSIRPHWLTIGGVLLVAVAAAPLPTLMTIGMEHTMHACLTLCFVYLSATILSSTSRHAGKNFALLVMITPMVTASRYEGLFVVFVAGVLLLIQKKILSAFVVGAAALLPVVIYGFISVAHGSYFFPNSVLLKGQLSLFSLHGNYEPWKFGALSAICNNRPLLFLFITSLVLLVVAFVKKRPEEPVDKFRRNTLMIFAGTLLLHMQFADAGWFYRYEAYLVLLGIVATGIPLTEIVAEVLRKKIGKRSLPYHAAIILVTIALCAPFGRRALGSLLQTPQAANNTYEQHYQMGRFISQFYRGETVVVNDIGAVTYLADIHLIDLCGLGSLPIAQLQLHNRYTFDEIAALIKKQQVAVGVFYDALLFTAIGRRFPGWVRVGQWEIPRNTIAADSIVSFYAVGASACSALERNLQRFATELPSDVKQYGKYTGKRE